MFWISYEECFYDFTTYFVSCASFPTYSGLIISWFSAKPVWNKFQRDAHSHLWWKCFNPLVFIYLYFFFMYLIYLLFNIHQNIHQNCTYFCDITLSLCISINCQWFSANELCFNQKNFLTFLRLISYYTYVINAAILKMRFLCTYIKTYSI